MKDFRRLDVWRKAHRLTLEIYGVTKGFPREELYGLTKQLRSAAASVGTNIAEGCGRSQGDFGRFLTISLGSATEVEYLLLLGRDLSLLSPASYLQLDERAREVKRMLFSLITRVAGPDPRASDCRPAQ
jgi:four helix bundle protein